MRSARPRPRAPGARPGARRRLSELSSASSRNGAVPSASAMLRKVSSEGSSKPRSTWLSIETLMPARSETVASVRFAAWRRRRIAPPSCRRTSAREADLGGSMFAQHHLQSLHNARYHRSRDQRPRHGSRGRARRAHWWTRSSRAATASSRSTALRQAATTSSSTRSTSPTRTPWPRRPRRRRRPGCCNCGTWSRSAGGALPEEKTGADVAELPLEVFRASLELNLVTAWITRRGCLVPLRRAERGSLDHADDLDGRARELRTAGLRRGEGGPDGLVHSLAGPLGANSMRIETQSRRQTYHAAQRAQMRTCPGLVRPPARERRRWAGSARPRTSPPRTWR